jgi:hypothetical protein
MHSRCTGVGQEHPRLNLWRSEQRIFIVLRCGRGERCKSQRDLVLRHVLLPAEVFEERLSPELRENCSLVAGGGCLQRRSEVVDDYGFFIPVPAVVEVFHSNWPWIRCFRFFQMRVAVFLPQPQMAEDAFYHVGFMN